jgi:hypothetical protein
MDTLPSGVLPAVASGPSWLVSSFRLRARLDFSIPSAFSGQRGCQPRFWIWLPSFGRQRDFNPPEQRAAQRTLPAPPPPSRLPPLSRCFRLYGLLLRPLPRRDEEGFSSCSVHPYHRAVATTPPECRAASVSCVASCCLRPTSGGSASGVRRFEATLRSLSLRPDDSLTILTMALSIDFQSLVSLPLAIQATGLLTVALVGLSPTENTCLSCSLGCAERTFSLDIRMFRLRAIEPSS